MGTYAVHIADRSARPVIIVRIEGIGEYGGLWAFCTKNPTYTLVNAKEYIRKDAWPEILTEEINPLGGIATSGQLTLSLVDVGNALISKFRTYARPQTFLSSAITSSASSITLDSNTGITAGSTVIFVGGEAIALLTLTSGTTYTCTRGYLGTSAHKHSAGDSVFLYTPYLLGRRMRLYVGFDEGSFSSGSENEIGGGWHIDSVGLGAGNNSWDFAGKSQLKYIDRIVNRAQFKARVLQTNGRLVNYVNPVNRNTPLFHWQDRLFFKIGDEVVRAEYTAYNTGEVIRTDKRGLAGTIEEQFETGQEIRMVFSALTDGGYGSFRYQNPGSETSSKFSGTWAASDHPVPIMLAILTGIADPTDLSGPVNYSTNTGNYSHLPPGVGLGIPIGEIDVDSFLNVWQRTQNYHLAHFLLDEQDTAREVLESQILKVTGFDLKIKNSKLSLDYFKVPLEGEATTTWDDSTIIVERDVDGNRIPLISAKLDTDITASSVEFKLRQPGGGTVTSIFTDTDYGQIFGNIAGLYNLDEKKIEIEALSVSADEGGGEPEVLKQRALQLLYRYRRPLWRIQCATDLSQEGVEPGDVVALTHTQLPDLATGSYGWSGVICKVLTKQVVIKPDQVRINWELIAYGTAGRFGRICPSAAIISVSTNIATVAANTYTDPQSRNSLADTDCEAFTVGDRVRLRDISGVPLTTSPTYQTIQSIGTNTITLDGNFGGDADFAAGNILEYIGRADATSTQYSRYVFMADATDRTVGASTQTPWQYAEP